MDKKIERYIRIPYEVIKLDISANSKLLYGMILSLTFCGVCKASNSYFAQELGLKSKRQVINLINELRDAGAVEVTLDDYNQRHVRPLIMFSIVIVDERRTENKKSSSKKLPNGGFESLYDTLLCNADDLNGGLESL